MLNLPHLEYHERNVEYGSIATDYSDTDAIELIDHVFHSLDDEFQQIFQTMISNGQVDFFPKKGKLSGARSISVIKKLPSFIQLNFTNKLADVLAIAHEFGHAIHYEYIRRHQNEIYFSASLATTEVASTFFEDFVLEEILKGADSELKLSIMMKKLNDDISTIIRQVACYQFEQELHQKFRETGYLSKDQIGELFRHHMAEYMGEHVKQSPGAENWWVHWGHIRSFFYVYSYASGLLVSKSLQSKVKQNPRDINAVKEYFSIGTSQSPLSAFANLGIDITQAEFWQEGLSEIENLLDDTEKLAFQLGKI